MTKGAIICFDGPDGVGKTTQINLLTESLKASGREVYYVKAVGGTPLTSLLGEALMIDQDRPPETDLHIALASQLAIAGDLKARRERGEIVLMDRSPLSIIAYQVYADGLSLDRGQAAVQELLDVIMPDKIVIYQVTPEVLAELPKRFENPNTDHFEKQPLDYHQKTAEGYKAAARDFKATVIDASGSVGDVFEATTKALQAVLADQA